MKLFLYYALVVHLKFLFKIMLISAALFILRSSITFIYFIKYCVYQVLQIIVHHVCGALMT